MLCNLVVFTILKISSTVASSVMYQHARRLATVGTGNALELVSEQARSYLAAINALCLVDRSYAWIFINRDGLNDGRVGIGPGTSCFTKICAL